jgi:tetratricopeptide (TPR) repeat protein
LGGRIWSAVDKTNNYDIFHRQTVVKPALADFQKALEPPLNLEYAWPYRGGRMPEIYCFIASAHEALGEKEQARIFYKKAVDAKQREKWSDLRYYQVMALKKIGEGRKAKDLLTGLLEFASIEPGSGVEFFSKFGETEPLNVRRARQHYLRGFVLRGGGEEPAAKAEFKQALALDINHM